VVQEDERGPVWTNDHARWTVGGDHLIVAVDCGKGDPGSTLTVSPFESTLRAALSG
jgi:hypothetical protein